MSHHQSPATSSEPNRDADAAKARTRDLQVMVLGAILAVLGPLGGFLAGSMIGPARELGDYDAMFIAMFIGLVIGGIGAVIAWLAAMRYIRHHGRLY